MDKICSEITLEIGGESVVITPNDKMMWSSTSKPTSYFIANFDGRMEEFDSSTEKFIAEHLPVSGK